MRIGPDGLPQPWAAESVTWADDKTIDVKLRAGMKWHDGKPVTIDDVIFSFEAPGRRQGADVQALRHQHRQRSRRPATMGLRFKLKQPNATFLTTSLAKINLIPKHIWEPMLKDLEGKPETAESIKERQPIGSGPFKFVRWQAQRGDRARGQSATISRRPRSTRWIMRIVPNTEATLGMLKRGEINFLGIFGGDPEVLVNFAKDKPDIAIRSEVDIGFEYRRPSTTAARRSTTSPSAARCRSPSTAADGRRPPGRTTPCRPTATSRRCWPSGTTRRSTSMKTGARRRPRRCCRMPATALVGGKLLLSGRQAGKADDRMSCLQMAGLPDRGLWLRSAMTVRKLRAP